MAASRHTRTAMTGRQPVLLLFLVAGDPHVLILWCAGVQHCKLCGAVCQHYHLICEQWQPHLTTWHCSHGDTVPCTSHATAGAGASRDCTGPAHDCVVASAPSNTPPGRYMPVLPHIVLVAVSMWRRPAAGGTTHLHGKLASSVYVGMDMFCRLRCGERDHRPATVCTVCGARLSCLPACLPARWHNGASVCTGSSLPNKLIAWKTAQKELGQHFEHCSSHSFLSFMKHSNSC